MERSPTRPGSRARGARGNPPAPERMWVLLTEAPYGGWGL